MEYSSPEITANFLIKIWCSAANQFYQMLNAGRLGKTYLIGIGIKAKIY